jgi:hypothetical protein
LEWKQIPPDIVCILIVMKFSVLWRPDCKTTDSIRVFEKNIENQENFKLVKLALPQQRFFSGLVAEVPISPISIELLNRLTKSGEAVNATLNSSRRSVCLSLHFQPILTLQLPSIILLLLMTLIMTTLMTSNFGSNGY